MQKPNSPKKVWTHKEFGEKLNEEFRKAGLPEVKEVKLSPKENVFHVISIRKHDSENNN